MSRTPSPSLCTRQMIEAQEEAWLAPYAERSANSRGRRHPAEKHPYRSEFQKDRDRIIHTTAFRRLQYKTQVFINYEGDYYRTRLTHTFEAAQIARTIARALRANPELAEASASVEPQEPPKTSQRSMPSSSRSVSMSLTRRSVAFSRHSPTGVERPAPRWSNNTMR